jgi:hypothetical protein
MAVLKLERTCQLQQKFAVVKGTYVQGCCGLRRHALGRAGKTFLKSIRLGAPGGWERRSAKIRKRKNAICEISNLRDRQKLDNSFEQVSKQFDCKESCSYLSESPTKLEALWRPSPHSSAQPQRMSSTYTVPL